MQDIPLDSQRTKSVFCFVVSPAFQRQGVAAALLERVIADAKAEGFSCVEAYPNKEFVSAAADFMGPVSMYEKAGFQKIEEKNGKWIMRKTL